MVFCIVRMERFPKPTKTKAECLPEEVTTLMAGHVANKDLACPDCGKR
jgi:hypothetical protein